MTILNPSIFEDLLALSDEEFDSYLSVSLANFQRVGPNAKKKLSGILKHYAKMKHPFTQCVKDNTKRFGEARAKKICAVLKDIIKGTTKWRSTERKKHLSESTLNELFAIEFDDDIARYLDVIDIIEEMSEETEGEEVDLAAGDIVWNPGEGYYSLQRRIQETLNQDHAVDQGYSDYWVEDVSKGQALVCYRNADYWIIPYSLKGGDVVLAEEEDWKPVQKAWVEANLAQQPQLGAELLFEDSGAEEEDGLIWKTILREGTWKMSPGPGQTPVQKPITVTKNGHSDADSLTISMSEIKKHFESGIIEHVTVPTSHADKVLENTGFVKKLRFGKDDKGRATLEAAIEFTEPDVKEKALRGTIPNVSGGVLFDYIHKESGKKYNAALAHVALTPHPWLNGMKPFGAEASENLQVVAFSEVPDQPSADAEGGDNVSTTETETPTPAAPEFDFQAAFGMSEEDLKATLERNRALEAEVRGNRIDGQIQKWQEEGKSPALLSEAKAILMAADDKETILTLSEDGGEKTELKVKDVVERLVAAAPSVKLSEDQVTEQTQTGEPPAKDTQEENKNADLSLSERADVIELIHAGRSEAEALEEVRAKREKS